MWLFLPISLAFAGTVTFDARIPAEIYARSEPVASIYAPGLLSVEFPDGPIDLQVTTFGVPHRIEVMVGPAAQWVLIGKSGITATEANALVLPEPSGGPAVVAEPGPAVPAAPAAPAAPAVATVELRSSGNIGVLVQLGKKRHLVPGGQSVKVEMPLGPHALSVRSEDGTVVYSTGIVELSGKGAFLIQLSDGKYPEFGGPGGTYRNGTR